MSKFKIQDKIDYTFYKNVTIIGEDEKHYILKDATGCEQKIYKQLVDKYGKKIKG